MWKSYCFITLVMFELCALTVKKVFFVLTLVFFLQYVSNGVTVQVVGAATV